jgi:hypothetical protein
MYLPRSPLVTIPFPINSWSPRHNVIRCPDTLHHACIACGAIRWSLLIRSQQRGSQIHMRRLQRLISLHGNIGAFSILSCETNNRGLITFIMSRSIFRALNTKATYPGSSTLIMFNCLINASISASPGLFIFLLNSLFFTVGSSSESKSEADLLFFEYLAFFQICRCSFLNSSSLSKSSELSSYPPTSSSESTSSSDPAKFILKWSCWSSASTASFISSTWNGVAKLQVRLLARRQFSSLTWSAFGIPFQ